MYTFSAFLMHLIRDITNKMHSSEPLNSSYSVVSLYMLRLFLRLFSSALQLFLLPVLARIRLPTHPLMMPSSRLHSY